MKHLTLKEMGYYLAMGAVIGFEVMLFLSLTGCTDRIKYTKTVQDPNGKTTKVQAIYTEGAGNSTKSDVTAKLAGELELEIGNSTTDQDKMFEAIQSLTELLEEAALRYGTGL